MTLIARIEDLFFSKRKRDYDINVRRRDLAAEDKGIGPAAFDTPDSIAINEARLQHLASLGLPLDRKRVLDVGCGVGHLSQFFLQRGCDVLALDGRQENIESLKSRYPDLNAQLFDVENASPMKLGMFDIVFCYGLLYHLENPFRAIRQMASVCREFLLLETMICDHELPVVRMDDETLSVSQALHGTGCRPSPSYVILALSRAGFRHIYSPVKMPDHQDFHFEWKNNLDCSRDGHPLRRVFIASHVPLQNPHVTDVF